VKLLSVIHVPAEQVGIVLALSGGAAALSFVLAFRFRDYVTQDPNRTLLSVSAMAAVLFVTLGLSSL
jgi:hypothetical protein